MQCLYSAQAQATNFVHPDALGAKERTKDETLLPPQLPFPPELLRRVTPQLSTRDLKSLSLTSRLWRIYSLPLLFNTITIRDAKDGLTLMRLAESQDVGKCVKTLNVMIPRHGRPFASSNIAQFYTSINSLLPNLRTVHWDFHTADVPSDFLSVLPTIKSIHFIRSSPSVKVLSSPLETLKLDFPAEDIPGASSFLSQTLTSSSPYLRQLVIGGRLSVESLWTDQPSIPLFPSLRSMSLSGSAASSPCLLQALVGSQTRIRVLALETLTSTTSDFLKTIGYIPTLQEFSWTRHNKSIPLEDVMGFLEMNVHLETLHIGVPLSSTEMANSVWPLLGNMKGLRSLKLVWEGSTIDDDSLTLLSRLTRLEELWLSVGPQDTRRHSWAVDHDAVLSYLGSKLLYLKSLAFTKDDYPIDSDYPLNQAVDSYISRRLPIGTSVVDYLTDSEAREYIQGSACGSPTSAVAVDAARRYQARLAGVAWERWHATKMTLLAERYARAFPALEWLFVGQRSINARVDNLVAIGVEGDCRDVLGNVVGMRLERGFWKPL